MGSWSIVNLCYGCIELRELWSQFLNHDCLCEELISKLHIRLRNWKREELERRRLRGVQQVQNFECSIFASWNLHKLFFQSAWLHYFWGWSCPPKTEISVSGWIMSLPNLINIWAGRLRNALPLCNGLMESLIRWSGHLFTSTLPVP